MLLTPFQVSTSKDSGYFAENTLAGSRLNTNLADLAASITVVTKQQMDDTASLDINDVFKYEASTEGSGSYTPSIVDRGTAKDSIAGYSFGNNGDSSTNAQANRVRGLAAPDAAINNFPTNNRIPFDSYNTQSVEITRGPNSLLFGVGNSAGSLSSTTKRANPGQRVIGARLALAVDQEESRRSEIDLHLPVAPGRVALRIAGLDERRNIGDRVARGEPVAVALEHGAAAVDVFARRRQLPTTQHQINKNPGKLNLPGFLHLQTADARAVVGVCCPDNRGSKGLPPSMAPGREDGPRCGRGVCCTQTPSA